MKFILLLKSYRFSSFFPSLSLQQDFIEPFIYCDLYIFIRIKYSVLAYPKVGVIRELLLNVTVN